MSLKRKGNDYRITQKEKSHRGEKQCKGKRRVVIGLISFFLQA